jgi:hypothetical protein
MYTICVDLARGSPGAAFGEGRAVMAQAISVLRRYRM